MSFRDGPKLPYSFRPRDFGVPSYIEILVTFEHDEELRSFQKAIRALEGLSDTQAFFVDIAESIIDHRASDPNAPRPPYLVGRVVGPYRKNIPDGNRPAKETAWGRAVVEILEEHDIQVEEEEEMAS